MYAYAIELQHITFPDHSTKVKTRSPHTRLYLNVVKDNTNKTIYWFRQNLFLRIIKSLNQIIPKYRYNGKGVGI